MSVQYQCTISVESVSCMDNCSQYMTLQKIMGESFSPPPTKKMATPLKNISSKVLLFVQIMSAPQCTRSTPQKKWKPSVRLLCQCSFAIKLEVVSDNAVIERSSVILPSKTSLYQSDSSFKSISGFHQSKTNHCTRVFLLHSPFWMGLPY